MLKTNDMPATVIISLSVLNDLVKMNAERVTAYEEAAKAVKEMDIDLEGVFIRLSGEAKRQLEELVKERMLLEDSLPEPTEATEGRVFKAWKRNRTDMPGTDKNTIIKRMDYSEIAAQKAYDSALFMDIDPKISQLLATQKEAIK